MIETINQWSLQWGQFMLFHAIDFTLAFVFVGLIWRLARKRVSAQFGYLLFLLVLAKLMVPGFISVPGILSTVTPSESSVRLFDAGFPWFFGAGPVKEGVTGDELQGQKPAPTTTLKSETTKTTFSIVSVLFIAWIVVVLALFIREIWIDTRLRFLIRNSRSIDRDSFPIDFDRLQQIAGIRRRIRWITGSWVKSPVSFGILHPAIAIPENLSEVCTSTQIRWILLHELAHVKREDSFVLFLQRVAQILFFFHPLVWWTNMTINQLREYACDDVAISGSETSSKDCGEGFLRVVAQANGLAALIPASLGVVNYETMIRSRLMRILDNKRKLHAKFTFGAGVFLLAVTLFVIPFSGRMAAAQVGEWLKVADTGPVDSMRASMVYDLARKKVVLFGGWSYAKGDDLGETWEWDGVQWTKVTTSGPSPRIDSQMMVYDTVREKVVLFGGTSYQGGWTTHNDMWEWDGAEWTRIMTDGPSPRQSPAMVFDSARGKIVLFGGLGASALGDTWEWDGAEWIQVAEEGPSPRAYHAMAYDSIRQRVVMHGGLPGGMYSGQKVLSDMWEWDGHQWTQVDLTGENPGFRAFHGMVFDDARGKTVLFSGVDRITGSGETIALNDSDIWEWDGNVWERISAPGPVSRASPAMIYDPIRREIVLFGGMVSGSQNEGVTANDTWVYSASSSGIPKSLWSLY